MPETPEVGDAVEQTEHELERLSSADLVVGIPTYNNSETIASVITAARAGLEVEWQVVLPQRSNLLLRLRPTGKVTQRLLLAPHLDTIGGAGVPGGAGKPLVTQRARGASVVFRAVSGPPCPG